MLLYIHIYIIYTSETYCKILGVYTVYIYIQLFTHIEYYNVQISYIHKSIVNSHLAGHVGSGAVLRSTEGIVCSTGITPWMTLAEH